MYKIELQEYAKERQAQMTNLLEAMCDACFEFDAQLPNGVSVSAFMNYDEQDMFRAIEIMFHVCGNYAIHHEILNEYNIEDKIDNFRECLQDTFGIDCFQEAEICMMLNHVKDNLQ